MPHFQSSASDLNADDENQLDFPSELFEQLGLNLSLAEDEAASMGTANQWWTNEDLGEGQLTLAVLRNACGEPLTQQAMARLRYHEIFGTSIQFCTDPYGKVWNFTKLLQRKYIEKIGRQIRSIDAHVNKTLDVLEGDLPRQLEYLRTVSLAIRIGEDEKGRALYVYHGPDALQSSEKLEQYVTWAEKHQAKNSRLLRLAQELQKSILNAAGIQIDNEDFPGEDNFDPQINFGIEG